MPADLEIRCACGKLRGTVREVSPGQGNRGVCYCDDCQSFAQFLGRADSILDARGGTPIFQIGQGQVALTHGGEHLACMRLTPKGLLRWYASCCGTPIGNTGLTPGTPVVGLVERCLAPPAGARSLDDVLGPSRFSVFAKFAREPRSDAPPPITSPPSPSRLAFTRAVLGMVGLVVKARWRGEGKRSPFFDPATRTPRATPRVLTPDELRAVEAARDAW
jgi:hypothetical protein